MMKCEICGFGIADGVSLFRQNAKGEPGRWRCIDHNEIEIDSVVIDVVSALEKEKCPRGKVGHNTVVDGICYECEGEEAARRARLEEKGIF